MRKPLQIALAVAVLVLGGATAFFFREYQKSASSYESMKASDQATRDQYAQTINAIAEIQDSLNALALGDRKMSAESRSLQTEQGLGGPSREQTLDRIALLRASILRSKERIQRLENDLHRGGIKVAGLQRMVANLKQSTAEKEQQVAELSNQVNELQTKVTGLTTQVEETQVAVQQKDEALAQKQRELATVYYVAGTKRELTQSGVVVAKGGLLGVGRTLQPSPHVSDGMFAALNTDQETVLHLPSAKAQVLSAQPASSYELRLVNGKMELHILDPQEFRKVRQLVIVTA